MADDNLIRQANLRTIFTRIEGLVEKHKKLQVLLGSNDHVKGNRIAEMKKKKLAVSALEAEINVLVNRLMVPMMLVDVNFHTIYPGPIDPELYNNQDHNVRLKAIRKRTQFWTEKLVDPTLPWVG